MMEREEIVKALLEECETCAERSRINGSCKPIYYCATRDAAELIKQQAAELAAYRAAEQDGTLVKLPCKVGDTVYLSDGKEAFEMQVGSLFPAGFIVKSRLCNAFLVDKYTYKCVVFSDFNKTVFLTPEAAEAALKEQEANQ